MLQTDHSGVQDYGQSELTIRQKEVLENALDLLVSGGGKALTTANIARASNCSKESLYKWFGDRNGLLAAMMTVQGSKVGAVLNNDVFKSTAAFKEYLVRFATELLTVLSGEISLALNRLAIGQASDEASQLGPLLMKNGRGLIEARAHAFLNSAKDKGFLKFAKVDETYRVLYGLIVSDFHVRLLLGDNNNMSADEIENTANQAVEQFYKLFGSIKS
ncbi:TetR/AcrR family transcriptional regulator [Lentilitoribacter sp. Alg239-R112]|uniref:TetR/AcrR family transcriptional regulator n=1 Tax=Lentilitoribacter sp. Alg239-R112 TaxID=2305987 RepID=UPI0013A68A90|nr:TetR/AcrR family transcriptional regulator [Lentilitoribacter sp. Alg239-R112]